MYLMFNNGNYIDLSRGNMCINGVVEPFPGKKPFFILKLLVEAERPISLDYIANKVWADDAEVMYRFDHIVANAVSHIRKQLNRLCTGLDKRIITCNKGYYSLCLPDCARLAKSTTDKQVSVAQTAKSILASIDYRLLDRSTYGIPVSLTLYNNSNQIIEHISITLKNNQQETVLTYEISFLLSKKRSDYVLGYIIDTDLTSRPFVRLVNDQSVEIKSLIPDFTIDVNDREILISANH